MPISSSTLKPSFWPCTQSDASGLSSVGSVGCAEALELRPRKERRVWRRVLTTLPGGILGSQALGTDWAAEASWELEKHVTDRPLHGVTSAPLGKTHSQLVFPKLEKSEAIVLYQYYFIYSVNIRIKQRESGGRERETTKWGKDRERRWDIWTAVRKPRGKHWTLGDALKSF